MLELLKKLLYAGAGIAAITEEKARELVSELEKKGHVSTEQGKELVNDLVEKGRQRSGEIKENITKETRKVISEINLVTKQDFDRLKEKVDELIQKIDAMG